MNRYSTLSAALKRAEDDDVIELYKDEVIKAPITKHVTISGNGCTLYTKNGSVGLDCMVYVCVHDVTFVCEPRSNGIRFNAGGRMENVTTKTVGPARDLYPTVSVKRGKLELTNCDIMKAHSAEKTAIEAKDCTFRDYYGGAHHIGNKKNLAFLYGGVKFDNCRVDCCNFLGVGILTNCRVGVFNRSSGKVILSDCMMAPEQNPFAIDVESEPKDGPLETISKQTWFSWELEKGILAIENYETRIQSPFVGIHAIAGTLELRKVKNKGTRGMHLIRNASVVLTDVQDDVFYKVVGDGTVSATRCEIKATPRRKTALEQLNELIGLTSVKQQIESILNVIKMNKASKNKDFEFSYHMVFAGDPGTGKTTVAKLVAKALFEIGAIPQNKCTCVSVDGLVEGYVGQTAKHVKDVLDGALGGVLFIDEAYELTARKGEASFNSEALSVLIRYMEEHRHDLIVIMAGYSEEMKTLLASNSGLTRRFQWINFEDYTPSEMAQMFDLMRTSFDEDYEGDNVQEYLTEQFDRLTACYLSKPDANGRITNGGNGGLVRNVFQQVIMAKANRLAKDPDSSKKLTMDDITNGFARETEKAHMI